MISEEYSEHFDELRKNRVEVSYHKYGPARKNFKTGNVQALQSMERCIEKYNSTGNTEYLNKPGTCRRFSPWNGVLRNIILPETQNISWMQQITSCSSLCTHSILKHTSKLQTAKIAPG